MVRQKFIVLGLIVLFILLSAPSAGGAENQLATGIVDLVKIINRQFGISQATVAAIDGNRVYLNAGMKQYVKLGSVFEIVAEGRPFNDPVRRNKLGVIETHVADIKIVTVRDNFSIGQIMTNNPQNLNLINKAEIKVGQKAIEKANKFSLAVVPFEYLNSKDKVTPRAAQEMMINELIKTGRFVVVESATTEQVVKQLLNINTPGTTPPSPDTLGTVQFTRNLGKMLGVNYIMYGWLTDMPGFMEIHCRVHDARTGVGIVAGDVQIVPTVVNPPGN